MSFRTQKKFLTYFASSPWCLQRDCEDICFIALMCRDVVTADPGDGISQVQINRTGMGGGGGVSPPSPVIQHIL